MYIFEVTLRPISCTLERLFNECTCPSQNLISDVLLCFLIPFSEIVSFVSYQKGLFQYFVKCK
jgi:hypothetical protein